MIEAVFEVCCITSDARIVPLAAPVGHLAATFRHTTIRNATAQLTNRNVD
jgi:hypothetical protein